MKFAKKFLIELLEDHDPSIVVEDTIEDKSRWTVCHRLIFRHDGKLYGTHYSVGATEYQDVSPFENESDEIECSEMMAVPSVAYVIKQ